MMDDGFTHETHLFIYNIKTQTERILDRTISADKKNGIVIYKDAM